MSNSEFVTVMFVMAFVKCLANRIFVWLVNEPTLVDLWICTIIGVLQFKKKRETLVLLSRKSSIRKNVFKLFIVEEKLQNISYDNWIKEMFYIKRFHIKDT
jgi:hypothetical protein